jgi:endonuclease/exonuclease/phosphatase (EEP) superfamily protein YafD
MGVRANKALDAFKKGEIRKFFFEISDTITRLKEGFNARDEQVAEVESYVAGSKYPVILCGDFNEIPFSYTYGKLSLTFANAFEEVGQGLGFTLNRYPYCVRIDQQFFSSDWQVQSCQIIPTITFSDHFPLMAQYILKKPNNSAHELLAHR